MTRLFSLIIITVILVSGCSTEKPSNSKEDIKEQTVHSENLNEEKEDSSMITQQNSKTTFRIPETYNEKATESDLEQFKQLERLFNENQETILFYNEGGVKITIGYAYFSNSDKKMTMYCYFSNGTETTYTDLNFKFDLAIKEHPEVPKRTMEITLNNSLIGDVEPSVTIPIIFTFEVPKLQTEQTFFSGDEFVGSSIYEIKGKSKE